MSEFCPHVCIDATPLDTSHRFRGIGTYVKGLLDGLAQCDHQLSMIQLRVARGQEISTPSMETLTIYRPPWPRTRLQWMLSEILLPGAIKKTRATLFHATDPRALPRRADLPLIATAYDLIPLVFPDHYLNSFPWDERLSYRRSLQRYQEADHIIAISAATKKDLIHYLGIDASIITITPLGYDADLFKPTQGTIPSEYQVPERFFLYVGGHDIRKNVEYMLRAYARVRSDVPEKFVFAGKLTGEESNKFKTWVASLDLNDEVLNLGFVPREVLPALYSRATAFVFPSRYEGFGLPPLEAMARGCPVIAGNSSSIPEVVDQAGCLFDLADQEALENLLVNLSKDAALREEYSSWGIDRAAQFSWKKCAEETLDVYRQYM